MGWENWDSAYVSTKNTNLNGLYAVQSSYLPKQGISSRQVRDAHDAALKGYDILLTPTLPYVATSHAPPDATPLDQIAKQIGLTFNTAPFNQSGHPVLALPIGMLQVLEGLGVSEGVQLQSVCRSLGSGGTR